MTPDTIINATAAHFGVRPDQVIGPGRSKTLIKARHIAASIIRERCDSSYPEISRILGYNDHTSALCAVRRARSQRAASELWAEDFDAIETALLDWREERELEKLEFGGP